jgi:hypothetical protein
VRDEDVDARLLALAERRRDSLRQQIDGAARAHRKVLEGRLRYAEQVSATDAQVSERIWQGIVRLYGDKPWATDLVARARSALATTSERSATEDVE